MMRHAGMRALVLLAAVGRTGCGGSPSNPTPVPTPTPFPCVLGVGGTCVTTFKGIPNATAFENVALVRSIEQTRAAARGQKSNLVRLVGYGGLDGRDGPANGWDSIFIETGGKYDGFIWSAHANGDIAFNGQLQPDPLHPGGSLTEIGPFLGIDSPEAIRLARSYGAEAYVQRHPNAVVGISYSFQFGLVDAALDFIDTTTPGACDVFIHLDAKTGELLARDLSCLSLSSTH